ncbi:MAG: GGDEF domain-containing protein [Aquabacterium sp.]|uniref:GGDEF domain-containing protein n=1 Tax=Aquabacterium sp. TaxID=1872578 RepID=UPI003BCA30D7
MADALPPSSNLKAENAALRDEVTRLNKVVEALMNRAERSTNTEGSDFGQFQTTLMLEDLVRRRTEDLESALRNNERITRELQHSEARFRGLANQSMVGIAIVEHGHVTYINPRLQEMYGYTAEELNARGFMSVVVDEDRAKASALLSQRLSGELKQVHHCFRARRKDGDVIDVELHGSSMEIDGGVALISLTLDVTERVRAEREVLALQSQLREQSVRDALTGLYNRRHLDEVLSRELLVAQRYHRPLSIVMADVDHFKAVNDRYGHSAGDMVLRNVADVLKRNARASDICCRYGGEEFLLVMPGMPPEAARLRAEQLRREIASSPCIYGDMPIKVTSSFGVASYPAHGNESSSIINASDAALYAAKNGGRNQVRSAVI